MEKKLPKVFANKVQKSTNEKVFYSSKNPKNDEVNQKRNNSKADVPVKDSRTIYQKINNIFSAPDYVYKANVIITTKEYKLEKTIIGQSKGHLITIENELIPVLDIIDIEKIEK